MNTLGLSSDPNKKKISSKYNTFCTLCRRKINKGEEVYTWTGNEFLVHLDCNASEVSERIHNTEFRRNIKKRAPRRARGGEKHPAQQQIRKIR